MKSLSAIENETTGQAEKYLILSNEVYLGEELLKTQQRPFQVIVDEELINEILSNYLMNCNISTLATGEEPLRSILKLAKRLNEGGDK